MSAIDLIALLSFASLIAAWALLPAGRPSESMMDEGTAAMVASVSEG